MGVAEDLFNEFVKGGEERLQRACDEHEPESLHLDFKQSKSPSGAMMKDDRKNLGENLSGFANASGGILVWGVDEVNRDDRNPQATAKSLKPIPNIARFVDDLNSQVGQLVIRPVDGVLNKAIDREDGSGFAITLIPESSRRPHMSMAADDKRYYIRSGSQTLAIDHILVEALMQVRRQAKIEVFVTSTEFDHGEDGFPRVTAKLAVRNVGEASANKVALTLLSNSHRKYRSGGEFVAPSIVHVRCIDGSDRQATQFLLVGARTLYPGMTLQGIEVVQTDFHNIGNDIVAWSVNSDTFNGSGKLSLLCESQDIFL